MTESGATAWDIDQTASMIIARMPLTGGGSKCYGPLQEGSTQTDPHLHLLGLLAAALTAPADRANQPEG